VVGRDGDSSFLDLDLSEEVWKGSSLLDLLVGRHLFCKELTRL